MSTMLLQTKVQASHIVGMDLRYEHVSGLTYKIICTAYGDCGLSSSGAFNTLYYCQPLICVFDGNTSVGSTYLNIQPPDSGVNIVKSIICAQDADSTSCTNTAYHYPGVTKFVYSGTYTLPYTSHTWRFVFNGNMNSGSVTGRASAISNIVSNTNTALQDTLDNTYGDNTNPNLGVEPIPFFCNLSSDSYNPAAIDINGDSLDFELVPGLSGSGSSSCILSSATVSYLGGYSASHPLAAVAGAFSFSQTTGQIDFIPSATQRALVVYNIREYRLNTSTGLRQFIGTSMREMNFIVLDCINEPPTGVSIDSFTSGSVESDSVHIDVCQNTGPFSFYIDPHETDTSFRIKVDVSGLPAGCSFSVANDSSYHPHCTVSWTSTGTPIGSYTIFLKFIDDHCPLHGETIRAYTMNIMPYSPITGPTTVCAGSTIALTDATTGGVWTSSNTSVATVNPTSGIVTGISSGITSINYTSAGNCTATHVITVYPNPTAIIGATPICAGTTVTMTDGVTGGNWSSSNPSIAFINPSTGVISGLSAGSVVIDYSFGGICNTTTPLTVNTAPGAISGVSSMLSCNLVTLSDAITGGTWSSGSTSIATISAGGTITGLSSGVVAFTYAIGSCYAIHPVTINSAPPISGLSSLCSGSSILLSSALTGGTWSSSNVSVATVGATTGSVNALSGGITTITYSVSGCNLTKIVTVNSLTGPIVGSLHACVGLNTSLSDLPPGGIWSSSSPAIATINSSTGVVTGVSVGTSVISYLPPTGCPGVSAIVTVNQVPAAITGSGVVCPGSSFTLTDATTGGTWVSSNPSLATVGNTTGIVTGVSGGTPTITYNISSTYCYAVTQITVNQQPLPILGATSICIGTTSNLTELTTGGTWSSTNNTIATISTGGVVNTVSVGVDTIVYTLTATGCKRTVIVTVNPLPNNISGSMSVCAGAVATLNDITTGGTWSSSNIGIANIGSTTGIVSGVSAGNAVITYTKSSTGCFVTGIMTVNPVPAPIAGSTNICNGLSTVLSDAMTGGSWSSGNILIATVNSGTGLVNATSAGVTVITYTIPSTGCFNTVPVTVNAYPPPITGTNHVCPGATTTLVCTLAGAYWTSSNTSLATVDSFTGIVTGVAAGTLTITYGRGCNVTIPFTVDPPAPISGINHLCAGGASTTLFDATTGGIWTSSNPSMASVSTSGLVTTLLASSAGGTVIITYTLPSTGCKVMDIVTINPVPSITPVNDSLCIGQHTTFLGVPSGGRFYSSYFPVASIDSISGVATGNSSGTTFMTYSISGCWRADPVYVRPTLNVSVTVSVNPNDTVCAGDLATFTANPINGGMTPAYQWFINGSTVVGATSGTITYQPINGNTVYCKLFSSANCPSSVPVASPAITMTVLDTIRPTLTMTSTLGDTICTGSINHYSVTSTLGGSTPNYMWSVNWIPVASGVTDFSYSPYNGDIIICKMLSSLPCPRPDTVKAIDTVVVKDYHKPRVSLLSSGGIQVCEGSPVTITANTLWGGWGPTYLWTLNGLPVATTGAQYSYTPADGDTIKCIIISNYICDTPMYSDSATAEIGLTVDPVINVIVTGHPGMLVTQGSYDTLIASVTNGGISPHYQWLINGIPVIGANSSYFIRNDFVNDDSVTCEVTTGSGTACEGVIGFHWMKLVVGRLSVCSVNKNINNIELLPNPNTGSFMVEGLISGNDRNVSLSITDVLGRTVYHEIISVHIGMLHKNIVLDENCANGVYILHISGENENYVKRFTLER